MNTRIERLYAWADTLDTEKLKKILVELVDYAIDSEEVSFWDDTTIPYYSNTGDNLDGSVSVEDGF